MPKQKTHSGAKKRFKLTGTGKVKRQQANRRHYLEHKSSRVTRRLASDQIVEGGNFRLDLVFCAENVAVVLREATHAHDTMQCAGRLVAVAGAKFAVA